LGRHKAGSFTLTANTLPTLPSWLPDETLFSLVSRYHQLSGNRLASHTCRELFGHGQQGTQHDFPTRLTHFVSATGSVLGDAGAIIQQRTILPFYLHFVAPEMAATALRTLEGRSLGGLKFRLGLITSRFRANHPLKACPECMQHDHDTHGTPYWHRNHQYPGVWICPTHGSPLLSSTVKSSGVGRFLWHLPHTSQMSSTFTHSATPGAHVADALSGFAQLSLSLAALPLNTQIAPEDLQHALMSELKQRDLATRTTRLRLSQICSGYLDTISPLTVVPELMQLCGSGQHIGSTLGKLLRPPRSGTHPLRYLGLIYWLFGSWPRFMDKLRAHSNTESQGTAPVQQAAPEDADNLRQHFLACMTHGGSVTHCAKSVGIDVSTGLVWAARAGMPINRRAKSINSRTYEDIARDLRAGHDKAAIAARHHVSAATVNRVLASASGLHDEWRAAMFASMQANARSAWCKALDSNAGIGVTALRKLHPATFAWLHRNDRTWLTQSCELVTRSKVPAVHRRIDWAARDMALEASVAGAVALIRTTSPDPQRQVRLWEIYQLVPELKAKLGALKKLPKTREAILRATKYAAATPKN
jgi:hypothetical protein